MRPPILVCTSIRARPAIVPRTLGGDGAVLKVERAGLLEDGSYKFHIILVVFSGGLAEVFRTSGNGKVILRAMFFLFRERKRGRE